MPDTLKTGEQYVEVEGGNHAIVDVVLTEEEVRQRLANLSTIRDDLESMREGLKSVIVAVTALQIDASEKLAERERLKQSLAALEADAQTAEALLRLPEDSFTRLFDKANAKGRLRGRVEGILIGLVTGAASSWLIWYVTK